jgi:hemerythrin-like metal-binding protein
MNIEWSDDLNTGVEAMDEHHEGMVERINELLEAVEVGRDPGTIRKLIFFFESFIVSHFALEEILQQRFSYPDYAAHYGQHVKLTEEFSWLHGLSEKKDLSPDLLSSARGFILKLWELYKRHIDTSDRQFAVFLKTRL